MRKNKAITVLGAGAWGGALSILLANNNVDVRLWSPIKEELDVIATTHESPNFLPGIQFPTTINVTYTLTDALSNADIILFAIPSIAFKDVLNNAQPFISKDAIIISVTKGLDPHSHQPLSDIVKTKLPGATFIALSGPSFAKEVAQQCPTAITLACENKKTANIISHYFNNDYFFTHISEDVLGTQIAGTFKNVLAIAVGIVDGLNMGANARAALITKALAEMMRLGKALGAKEATFLSFAGLGDLVLTATDDQSRNRCFGFQLGQGKPIKEALSNKTVEGVKNAAQVLTLATQCQVELPICQGIQAIIDGADIKQIVNTFFQ